jgi:hypothetical protein
MNKLNIQYVQRNEIDKVKWNSCVHYATNGNIFGYMWYLDHIAKDWDALIEGDYESVMPLIWKEDSFKRKELHQPKLIRESGIYSIHILSEARIQQFLTAIPDTFRKAHFHLNEQNRPPANSKYEVTTLQNYQLFLNEPYETIANSFSRDLLKRLQVAEDEGLVLTSSVKPEQIADFYRRYQSRNYSDEQFHGLQRIMYNAMHRGWGFPSAVMDTSAQVLAVNFFIYSHKKVMSLVPIASPEGQQKGALAYLLNGLIRSHANKPSILDFNAPLNESLALDFGARPNNYYQLYRNERVLGLF